MMLLCGTATAESRPHATVTVIDDPSASLSEADVLAALPNTATCFGKTAASVSVVITIEAAKVKAAKATGSGNAKIDSCVQNLASKMKVSAASASIRLQIVANEQSTPNAKTVDKIKRLRLSESLARFTALKAEPMNPQTQTGGGIGPSASDDTGIPTDDSVVVGKPAETRVPVVKVSSPTGSMGKHTTDEIERIVRSRASVYRSCYETELANAPELAGSILFHMTIARDGTVSEVKLEATTTPQELIPIGNCIAPRLLDLKFPARGTAVLSIPMVFSSQP